MTTVNADVVLRNALLHSEAVRVGRRPPALALAPAAPVETIGATRERDALLEQALAEARAEGVRLGREEGLRAGYEEGLKKGEAEAKAAQRGALDQAIAEATKPLQDRERHLAALGSALAAEQARLLSLAEDEAVVLAYEVACRVLGEALLTPDGVRAQARELLAAARQREAIVHVHPDDAQLLQQHAGGTGLQWRADPEVRLGGCRLQGSHGVLDARLETVLEQCRQAVLEVRARAAEAGA